MDINPADIQKAADGLEPNQLKVLLARSKEGAQLSGADLQLVEKMRKKYAPAPERALNNKDTAAALNIDESLLAKYATRAGFPSNDVGGVRLHNADEVRAWLDSNGLGKRRGKSSGDKPASRAQAANPIAALAQADDPFILALKSGKATPVVIAHASVQLAARQLADQAIAGVIMPAQFDSLKRAVEELRKAEEQYMELAVRKGELIERPVAAEIIGACAQRLVQVGANMSTAAAAQCEVWDGDAEFQRTQIDERKRKRIEWFNAQFNQVRALESVEIEQLLNDAISQTPADAKPTEEPAEAEAA